MAYDAYTKSLLHFGGADASTIFLDEYRRLWTANGNVQVDTAQSVFGGSSGLFDGTGDFITSADSSDWQLDGGSDSNTWTIDFWVRFNGDPGTAITGFIEQRVDNNNLWGIVLNNIASDTMRFIVRSASVTIVDISNAWNPVGNTWYHVAVVKDGTNGYMMFIDGTQIGTTQVDTSPIPDFAASLSVGTYAGANYLNGWMDELRISKGVARWTANFTPPAAPYDDSYVQSFGEYLGAGSTITRLLYHLNGNSNDVSGNSRNGTDTAITYGLGNGRFNQGASFNGTTSKIAVPSAAGVTPLSAYTILVWFKTSQATSGIFYAEGRTTLDTPFLQLTSSSSGVSFACRSDASVSSTIVSASAYNDNLWHLACAVKVAANSRLLYVDGILVGSDTANLGTTTVNTFNIGVLQRTGNVSFYSGVLDEVVLEGRAWTDSEIRKYYTWAKGRFVN